MNSSDKVIKWLLDGDVSIQYQVHRDLLNSNREKLNLLQDRIEKEGWGFDYLKNQNPDGHWGIEFYQPKWTSTHYTLLELKNLQINSQIKSIKQIAERVLELPIGIEGGINPAKTIKVSDVCLNGMILNYCSYFIPENKKLDEIVDYLLVKQMDDLGWNCEYHNGAKHSSLHTTLSVLEGFFEFKKISRYRETEIHKALKEGIEFILQHKLYKSDKTGEIINKQFIRLSYPSRWRYDILRCLDFLAKYGQKYDERMKDSLDVLRNKMDEIGRLPVQARHQGKAFFDYEEIGKPSRWNTLRGIRVINHFL